MEEILLKKIDTVLRDGFEVHFQQSIITVKDSTGDRTEERYDDYMGYYFTLEAAHEKAKKTREEY